MVHLNAMPAPKRCQTCNMPLWMSEKEKREQLIDRAVRWVIRCAPIRVAEHLERVVNSQDLGLMPRTIDCPECSEALGYVRAEFRRLNEASLVS